MDFNGCCGQKNDFNGRAHIFVPSKSYIFGTRQDLPVGDDHPMSNCARQL